MSDSFPQPRIIHQTIGRALLITREGRCYISRKYDIYCSDDWGITWKLDCRIPASGWKSWAAMSQPLSRLLRHNIQAFQVLDDGSRIAIAHDGLYRADAGEAVMKRTFTNARGSRPLTLCTHGARLIFGEYGDGFGSAEIFLYVSEDYGKTWDVGYRFPSLSIRHVHNILIDPLENHYWVLVGDYDREPGIGALSKDLRNIDWLIRGCPEARVVGAIVKPDCLLYGTDLDHGPNHIIRLDKRSGNISKLLKVEGSSLYASSFGSLYAISTCVEPNPTHPTRECALYLSRDGIDWSRKYPHRKDWLHPTLFQFGCLVLPFVACDRPRGMFSGQAVVKSHDLVTLLDFSQENP